MDPAGLERIRRAYYPRWHPLADHGERAARRAREALCGVDLSIFDDARAFFRDCRGEDLSPRQALERARDKKRHKQAWFVRARESVDAIMQFYREVDVYPFRQPYLHRFGGFRWFLNLVRHVPHPRVLEYGCGSAVLTEYWLRHAPHGRYSVADIPSTTQDFVMWKRARYGYPLTMLTIGPGRAGIPLREPYDLIVCKDVLEHTPNPLEIAEAFCAHLAPGGVLVLDFLNSRKGENLERAWQQRDAVKALLKADLIALKAIDEPRGYDGLYVKDAA
jgi:SAM-dependent methyltransferase